MDTTYYVRRRGRVEGPWPLAKLRSEVALRKLGKHDEVSEDGAQWLRAAAIEGLFVELSARKPARTQASAPAAVADDQPTDNEDEIVLAADDFIRGEQPQPHSQQMTRWHCAENDVPRGVYTTPDLVEALEAGHLTMNALVWREGYADWIPVTQCGEVMSSLNRQRPTAAMPGMHRTPASVGVSLRAASSDYALWIGIASFVLSWAPLVGFAGIFAIILGTMAHGEIRRSPEPRPGAGRATAGIILGILSILIGIGVLVAVGYQLWQPTAGDA